MKSSERRPLVRIERDGAVAIVVIDNPPVNAGSLAVRQGVLDAITEIAGDAEIEAAVLIGAGSTFISGSDIREFDKPLADPQLPVVIAAIENCAKPVIAALHGAALGGGFELALGCDGRIAAPGAVVGLPEVKLGVIPGAGGTQRVPRLIGVSAAIEMITTARRIRAGEARQLGLVDAIAEGDLRTDAISFVRSWKLGKRRLSECPVPAEPESKIEAAAQAALKKSRGRPAAEQAIVAIRSASSTPFQDALADERRVFQHLRSSEEAAALRHLFFAERNAGRIPGLEGAKPRPVESVGVVGAGTMGVGIAIAFADAGLPTTLVEIDGAALRRGTERVSQHYKDLVAAGRLAADEAERRVALIRPAAELSSLNDADLIIEAVFEDVTVKQELFRALDGIAKSSAILASNTSYIDLNVLAKGAARPGSIVGLHFFSPANVMRLLEIVQGSATSPDVLASALAIGKRLGKVSVVAQVGEGFIGNRIYSAYRNQCEFMLEEGAQPQDVDAALQAFGFAMGPFAVGDLSGLDIAWRTRQRLAATRDKRTRYVDILDKLCERGSFGRKAGKGWYAYPADARRGVPYDEVRALVEEASLRKGINRRALAAPEIASRALGAILNEAALVLAEGIAQRASDIDLTMVNGFGFPDYLGGPIFWASRRPRAEILAALDAVEQATGFGFRRGDVGSMLDRLSR